MINQGRRKRKLDEDDEDDQQTDAKLRCMAIKTEPEQVIETQRCSLPAMHVLLAVEQSAAIDSLSTFARTTIGDVFEFRLS